MVRAADDTDVRARLIDTAARLLDESGPSSLSTRRLATEAGTSTMAVYTHFGGLPALIREVVNEGFARLAQHLATIQRTDDPMEDLRQTAVAYRANALANPHLYAVMFGTASLGGYRVSEDDRVGGLPTFMTLVDSVQRAMDADVLRPGDAALVAAQLWSAIHGFVMLEVADFFHATENPEGEILWPMLTNLAIALGGPASE